MFFLSLSLSRVIEYGSECVYRSIFIQTPLSLANPESHIQPKPVKTLTFIYLTSNVDFKRSASTFYIENKSVMEIKPETPKFL